MSNYRKGRVDEEIMREMANILRTVKDPRVSGAFLSVTAVDCTPDLKFAKIYYSVMSERRKGDAQKGLENATGYIRTCLARELNLRITPELKFIPNEAMKHGAHISELLKQVEAELEAADARDAALVAENEDSTEQENKNGDD